MDINTQSGANYRTKDSSLSSLSRNSSDSGSSQPSYMVTSLNTPLAPPKALPNAPIYIEKVAPLLLSTPSFYSLGLTGLLNLVVLILVIYHRGVLGSLSVYQTLCLIIFLNISLGVHGLLHMGSEAIYGFNPLMTYFN